MAAQNIQRLVVSGRKIHLSRRKAREMAFKVIFQVDQVEAEPQTAFKYLVQEEKLAEKDSQFAWQLIEGTIEVMGEIDCKIASYAHEWDMERMSSVDRNIMRVAGFEILFMEESQPVVAIDEAIEITKKYGDMNSRAFVNAILDKMLGEKNDAVFRD